MTRLSSQIIRIGDLEMVGVAKVFTCCKPGHSVCPSCSQSGTPIVALSSMHFIQSLTRKTYVSRFRMIGHQISGSR